MAHLLHPLPAAFTLNFDHRVHVTSAKNLQLTLWDHNTDSVPEGAPTLLQLGKTGGWWVV